MTTALTTTGGGFLALADAAGALPAPFAREIFLQDCHVAGMMHVADILV